MSHHLALARHSVTTTNRRSQRCVFQLLSLRSSSTFANNKESVNLLLNPFYVTGFSDAESSFILSVFKRGGDFMKSNRVIKSVHT